MSRELRIEMHAQGKALMKKSEWRKAASVFNEARKMCGDNLMLLIDLAACEYMDGSLFTWKKILKEIELALEQHRTILSPNTLYNASLFLGKFLEEQGQFKAALQSYNSVIEGEGFEDRHKIMCLSQVVRVLCFLGFVREAEESFVDLSARVRAYKNDNQHVEVMHALMWGELTLVGVDAALGRYERARSKAEYQCDLPLLFYDLLDGMYSQQVIEQEALQSLLDSPPLPESGFEKTLLNLAQGKPVTYREAFENADQMSVTLQFRLAFLVSLYGHQPVDRARATKLISILLRSFDTFSAKALSARCGVATEAESSEEIRVHKSSVEVRGESLNWNRRATALALLSELIETPTLEVEEVVKRVWQSEYNPSYADRLRVLIRRINIDLQSVALRPEILVMNSGRISVAEGISLKRGQN